MFVEDGKSFKGRPKLSSNSHNVHSSDRVADLNLGVAQRHLSIAEVYSEPGKKYSLQLMGMREQLAADRPS